jgi:hypothetical protein
MHGLIANPHTRLMLFPIHVIDGADPHPQRLVMALGDSLNGDHFRAAIIIKVAA